MKESPVTLTRTTPTACLRRWRNAFRRGAKRAAFALALVLGLAGFMGSARALDIPADLQIDLRSIVVSKDELLCLAANDYWEARSEDIAGRIAVARVVLNRAMDPRFPSNICDVVKQKKGPGTHCQFSWVCENKTDEVMDPKVWRDSLKIAAAVLQKDCAIPDPTDGALWYHASFTRPTWSAGFESTTIIGTHVFYREPDDLSKPMPTRKPFIYRLNAFAEFAGHRRVVTTIAMATQAVLPVTMKSDAMPAEPLTP
jgi:hypothetical protein